MVRASDSWTQIDTQQYHREASTIVAWQFLLAIAVAGLGLWISGPKACGSALGGGLINAIASWFLAYKLFRFTADTPPTRIVRAFYLGEVTKIALTVAFFTVAIVAFSVDVLWMLIGYLVTASVYWFALLNLRFNTGG
jgi:ATP synthase protein I